MLMASIYPIINLLSAIFGGLIFAISFPFPFVMRKKVNSLLSKLYYPVLILMAFLTVLFIQEFAEQTKYNKRRRQAVKGETVSSNLHYFASNYFLHQRNMYIILTSIACVSIFMILSRLVDTFINEHNCLLEQLNVIEQAEAPAPKENE